MRTITVLLALLLLGLSAMLVKLTMENRDLRARLAATTMSDAEHRGYLPPIRTQSVRDRDSVAIASGERQTLLVFTTTCGFCRETVPVWRELLLERGSTSGVIGVSLDPEPATRSYLASNPLPVPVVSLSEREQSLLGLGPVPRILSIDERGKLTYARTGSLAGVTAAAMDSVRRVLAAQRY